MLWIGVAIMAFGVLGVLLASMLEPLTPSAWSAWFALLVFSIGAALIGTYGLIALLIRALESAK